MIAKHGRSLADLELAKSLRVATRLEATRVTEDALPIGASRLGGRPDLPPSLDWPRWNGFAGDDHGYAPAPLSFLAQLNLAETPDGTGLLPETGWLVFFYDAAQQPWGFDPRERGCARVFHVEGDAGSLRRRDTPAEPPDLAFPAAKLTPSLVATLPGEERMGLALDDRASDAYARLAAHHLIGRGPHHQLLGWPKQIQGEMELECQLVTNGIYCGDADGYDSSAAQRLRAGAADWILLLQLDSDERRHGLMWGDVGCIYFWIRKQDLAARRFDDVWTILQCG